MALLVYRKQDLSKTSDLDIPLVRNVLLVCIDAVADRIHVAGDEMIGREGGFWDMSSSSSSSDRLSPFKKVAPYLSVSRRFSNRWWTIKSIIITVRPAGERWFSCLSNPLSSPMYFRIVRFIPCWLRRSPD